VTNNIGNEARIEIHYSNMEEMIDKARFYTTQRNRKLLFTNNVAFFCVAIKKEVIDKVGLLDEQFEIGFFEDDDYCKRASENKYRIAIVEDSFVHHHLNATFNKMDDKRRQQIFNINKERFEAKWGEWQPHQYRSIRSEEDD
jgi:GT2 family glycosyltransferase